MYTVYILFSEQLNRYYIGYTEDIGIRLAQHNLGISKYTSKAKDWKLVYSEEYPDRASAHKRELEIKGKKSRGYTEWLISSAG